MDDYTKWCINIESLQDQLNYSADTFEDCCNAIKTDFKILDDLTFFDRHKLYHLGQQKSFEYYIYLQDFYDKIQSMAKEIHVKRNELESFMDQQK